MTWRMKLMSSYKTWRKRAKGLFCTLCASTETIEYSNKHRPKLQEYNTLWAYSPNHSTVI